jgi:cell division protein ZapA (FtsZ GTPase activity inhibitor)
MNGLSKNRINLNICGCECVISSEDSEGYMRSVGEEVQKTIETILDRNERISVTMAAITAALSYCDDAHKATDTAENLRRQIKDYLEDSSHARLETEESRREIERLKREIQTLRARLSAAGEEAPEGAAPEKAPPIAPGADVPHPQTGSFSRVTPQADGPDPDGFMSFFEKKNDEP